MNKKIVLTLVAILLFVFSCAGIGQDNKTAMTAKELESQLCGDGTWGIFLPDDKGNPAPNIKLMNLQHWSDDDICGHNITMDEIMEINKDVKQAAKNAFGASKANFEVMVRFTLTTNQQSTAELQYKDAGASEFPYLENFRNQLLVLTNYRAKKGTIYVVFHYSIEEVSDKTEVESNISKTPNTSIKATGDKPGAVLH